MLKLTNQDMKVKEDAAQVNIAQLRYQLNEAHAENAELTKQITKQEVEIDKFRKERNQAIDERDQLLESSDNKDNIINRLQVELKSLDNKHQHAVSENGELISSFVEMEPSIKDKEKRLEKEIDSLSSEIVTLTVNLTETTSELVALKEEYASATTRMEMDLKQKLEELHTANLTIFQLHESKQRDEGTVNCSDQVNESDALIKHYKRELDAKIKLAELYKASLEDCKAETTELTTESTKLQQMLQQSTQKCEVLESKLNGLQDQHQSELNEKQETIAKLMDEVKVVNGLLKAAETDNAEKVLEKMFPRAAAANRLLKNNSSLTDIYSSFHDALGNVNSLEAECLQLNTNLERLTVKLQETTSEYDRQRVEYKNTLKMNAEMTDKINNFVAEQDCLREKFNETTLKLTVMERENTQLKSVQNDLARQICNLLNNVESPGDELTADQQQFQRMGLSNEDISRPLVTFNNVVQLQENNQKLILTVRELSGKVERLEEVNIGLKGYEEKLVYAERRLSDAEQSRQASEDLLAMSLKQKERFKQLYFDVMKYLGKEPVTEELDKSVNDSDTQSLQSSDGKDKKLSEEEEKLLDEIKELKKLREEYKEYRKDKTINFNILQEEYDTMENKVIELYSVNSQLESQAKFASERAKSQQVDITIYKQQIQILEDRNQMYDKTITKHELALRTLRGDALNSMLKISAVENRCEYLEQECRRLLATNNNLETENKAFHRRKMMEKIMECNLELMKISSERSDFESRVQMEKQLDDQVCQYETLARKLEDEQCRFQEETKSLKRQKDSAIKKMTDEQTQANVLRMKLSEAREQIEVKNQQIKNLSENLQEALTPCKLDNLIAKGNKINKELEVQVKQLQVEQLKRTAELELLVKEKVDFERKLKALQCELQTSLDNESNLKSHVEELQQEIRLQLANAESKSSDAENEKKLKSELKDAVQTIGENKKELQELRTVCHKLKENLQVVESKYANKMLAHSSDLQMLTSRKEELNKCRDQMHELELAKEQAVEMLKSYQSEWAATNKKSNENRQELQRKVEDLEKQNMELLDLMQAQNSKTLPSGGESINDSYTSMGSQSMSDEQFKEFSSQKLFSVVKYLRREKDIAVAQMETFGMENTRLLSELDIQKKRINELNLQLTVIKSPVSVPDEGCVASTTKEEESIHDMDTLEAVTDSNIYLRAEKDNLERKFNDLIAKLATTEEELLPLQEKNREFLEKYAQMNKENNQLRENVDEWKRKLSDQQNNQNEELKQVERERDSLAEMLTKEVENLRQVNAELTLMTTEKSLLERQLAAKTKLLQATTDERLKLHDELNNYKQMNAAVVTSDVNEIKQKEKELKAMERQLLTTNDSLQDIRKKEIEIRKVAKQYKELYAEVTTKELPALKEEVNKLKEENENLKRDEGKQLLPVTDLESNPSTSLASIETCSSNLAVKSSSVQSVKQSAPINLWRIVSAPVSGMKTTSTPNNSTSTEISTSETSNVVKNEQSSSATTPSVAPQRVLQKRLRDSDVIMSPTVVETSCSSENMSPQNKRSRMGEKKCEEVTKCGSEGMDDEEVTQSDPDVNVDKKDVDEGMDQSNIGRKVDDESETTDEEGERLVIVEDEYQNDSVEEAQPIQPINIGNDAGTGQELISSTSSSATRDGSSDSNRLDEPMVEQAPVPDGIQLAEHHVAEVYSPPITTRSQRSQSRVDVVNQRRSRSYNRVGRYDPIPEDQSGNAEQVSQACTPVSRGRGKSRRSNN